MDWFCVMESSKTKLARMLAESLERDVGSFSRTLQEYSSAETELSQSNLLTQCDDLTPSCKTGERLMVELRHPISSDVALEVKDQRFLCHKEVLSARCEYFNAMLQNKWSESESYEIALNNSKPEAVAALLCFLYGASVEIPKFCSLLDVLQISDMFGVKDLVNVAKFHIKTEMCHSFHRPCKVCISSAPEVIQLAAIFSLTDLFDSFLKWNAKYFYKLWPTKGFASLQADLRKQCVKAVVETLSIQNAISLLKESDKLLSGITRVQWTKSVVDMGTELMTACCDFISANILNLTTNKSITELFEGLGWKTDIIERILLQIGDELSIESVCNAHLAVSKLLYFAEKEKWTEEFPKMLEELKKKITTFLVSNYYAEIHTESWQLVSASDKMELKSKAPDHGDTSKKLSKRPVLSSSLNKKPPTPAVLKKQPMKIKPRKIKKGSNGTKQGGTSIKKQEQDLAEPPPLSPIISIQKFLPGSCFYDVAIGPHLMLHD